MTNAGIDPSALAAQRRRRIHALRLRVAAGAVCAFLAIWAVLFVQLATGHDPGLNDASTVAVVQSADPEASSSGASDSSSVIDAGSDSSNSLDSGDSPVGSGAFTTSQS